MLWDKYNEKINPMMDEIPNLWGNPNAEMEKENSKLANWLALEVIHDCIE